MSSRIAAPLLASALLAATGSAGGTIAQGLSFDGTVPVNFGGELASGRYTLSLTTAGIAEAGGFFPTTTGGSTLTFQVASSIASFCDASDGALASCPCANPGNPDTGCDIAQSTGGVQLEAVAQTTDPMNLASWEATGFPGTSAPATVLIRASSLEAAPVPFGDGLRCIGTPVTRVSAAFAIGGTAVHSHGHGAGGGDFHYQVWFRNTPAAYCTPDAFNLSNGQTLSW